jgi:phosphoglycolate phosphatase
MNYNLCLFDLDGTLTDPKLGITKSYQHALSTFGIYQELDSLIKFIGPPLREVFREHYSLTDADTERAVAKFREYFSVTGLLENSVYDGVDQALQTLKNNGVVMAVVTSKVTDYARRILEYFRLNQHFDSVYGDDMDGSLTKYGKRDILRIALDALDPEHEMSAVMIGDRKHDVIGATDNDIDSIGVTWGYGSREELVDAGATRIVESVGDLCRLILEGGPV